MGKIKYQLISICFLVLAIGFQSIAVENKNFLDVEEEKWYYEEVYAAVNYGLMDGMSSDSFGPELLATRAQVVQTIYNMSGENILPEDELFSDVEQDDWYASAITWASKKQIAAGYPDGTFQPNKVVNRQDLVVFLYRYVGEPKVEEEQIQAFDDYDDVSDYAIAAMTWSVSEGIVVGDGKGNLCPKNTATRAELAAILVRFYEANILEEEKNTVEIPILLYHHLSETEAESGTVLSPANFEHQMKMLYENGYQTVSFEDLIQFVENGKRLPEKAVVITFDDGYYSNYEYAFPILQKYGFKATIFVIGHSIGQDMYKDTEHKITPHFGTKEMQEMLASGLISIHSHTYDMHQWAPYESGEVIRENMLPLAGESEEEYTQALLKDVEKQDKIFAECGLNKSNVLAFPTGKYTSLTDEILISCGYKVTVTTDESKTNTLVQGQAESLIDLGRMNISGSTTKEQILEYCEMR